MRGNVVYIVGRAVGQTFFQICAPGCVGGTWNTGFDVDLIDRGGGRTRLASHVGAIPDWRIDRTYAICSFIVTSFGSWVVNLSCRAN